MKTITCIRHAQPEHTPGVSDPGLSSVGITQASVLNGHYDLIVLSPLRRAIETYTRSNISGSKVIISDLAREQLNSDGYNQLRNETLRSETTEDMYRRMNALRQFLIERPEEEICVFSSAFAICYLQQVCGLSSRPIGYTEVLKIELPDE